VYADPAGHPFCLIVQADPDLVNEIRSVLQKESARAQ
jgi:hypothetical protein